MLTEELMSVKAGIWVFFVYLFGQWITHPFEGYFESFKGVNSFGSEVPSQQVFVFSFFFSFLFVLCVIEHSGVVV